MIESVVLTTVPPCSSCSLGWLYTFVIIFIYVYIHTNSIVLDGFIPYLIDFIYLYVQCIMLVV